ncbi:MAG: hypothetical protein RB296_05955 [Acidobacteriota bacterium]|nr:hypothetical protein [Acidobacteriota bacterium]
METGKTLFAGKGKTAGTEVVAGPACRGRYHVAALFFFAGSDEEK